MLTSREPFNIAYCGVTIKITPLVNDSHLQYIISLPTREVTIEPIVAYNRLSLWQEIPAGPTEIAEAIGALIEQSDG